MKILVFADTHGNTEFMQDMIFRKCPDMVIHLGDHSTDSNEVHCSFPDIPFYSVRGNCDMFSTAPDYDVIPLKTVNIFITHGHLYNVNYGVDSLVYKAQEENCKIALFGHTHVRYHEDIGGVKVVNPGTAGKGKVNTCAMLEINNYGAASVSFFEN